MSWVGVVLISLSFLGAVHGQLLHYDIGSSIVVPGDEITTSSSSRKSCYSHPDFYYTNGSSILDEDENELFAVDGADSITGMACCCNLIAVTFTVSAETHTWFYEVNSSIIVKRNLGEGAPPRAVITCNRNNSNFYIVSRNTVWTIPIDNLETGVQSFSLSSTIDQPGCVAHRNTGSGVDLFVSCRGCNRFSVVQIPSVGSHTITTLVLEENFDPVRFYCIDYDEDSVYLLLTLPPTFDQYNIREFDVANVLSNSLGTGTTVEMGTHDLEIDVNGLSVCGTTCQDQNCTAEECDCSGTCGFCAWNSNVCQCNMTSDQCCYAQPAPQECTADEDDETTGMIPDACLIVQKPLANRKSDIVRVIGVMEQAGNVNVSRLLQIGRFPPTVYPVPVLHTTLPPISELSSNGFESQPNPTGSMTGPPLRGSRFGVYRGTFEPSDSQYRSICIVGLVTENSGWFNIHYTQTVNEGENVSLTTSFKAGAEAAKQIDTFVWKYTRINQSCDVLGTFSHGCEFPDGKQNCYLKEVSKATNEGVYQVYRPGPRGMRFKRVWHPFVFLFVRNCSANQWGANCMDCPNECVHGLCDTGSGDCRCYPGWMGADCNESCSSPDLIGNNCTISCSSLGDVSSTDCVGLEICKPFKLGCACRSGLKPPTCTPDCDTGFFGVNCASPCSANCVSGECNPRTGACT